VSWYLPGTTTDDLRDCITARLGLHSRDFVLEDGSGEAVALSAALPPGLSLVVRAAVSVSESADTSAAAAPARTHPARAPPAQSPLRQASELSEPLLKTTLGAGGTVLSGSSTVLSDRITEPAKSSRHADPAGYPAGYLAGASVRSSTAAMHLLDPMQSFQLEADMQHPATLQDNVDSMLRLNRMASFLANERTFLAWIRTSCSLFGLAISTLSLSINEEPSSWRWLALSTGLVISLLAGVSYGHGVERYFRLKSVLFMHDPPAAYGRRSIQPFAIFTAAVWVGVIVAYIVRGLYVQDVL